MKTAKALQGHNLLTSRHHPEEQSDITKNCLNHTSARGKDMLTERDGYTERPVK